MVTPKTPTKYRGTDQYLVPFVTRDRQPTGADFRQPETGKLYPIGCVWQVGKNPTTGSEGQLYMLSKIVANVAYWILQSGGATPALLSLTTDISGPVTADVNGNILVDASVTTFTDGSVTNTLKTEVQGTNHALFVGRGTEVAATNLAVGTNNTVLLGATASDPTWGTVPNAALTNSTITLNSGNNITVTGSPISLGGAATVNVSGTTTNRVQIGNASGSLTSLDAGSSGQVLQSQGASAPAYSTATYPSTATSTGTILRANGTNWVPTTATYPSTAGTSGNILTSDGTGFVSSTNYTVGSSLVLISSQSASASSTIEFLVIGASTYRKFILFFRGIRPGTVGALFNMQGSNDSGATWITSTYTAGCNYNDYNSATMVNSNSTTGWVLSGPLDNSTASRHASGICEIWTVSAGVTRVTGNVSFYNNTTGVESYGYFGGVVLTNSLNSLRCLMSAGTFSGSLQLYGVLPGDVTYP